MAEDTQGKAIALTDGNFDEAISSGSMLVDFMASWCGPCRSMSPIVEEIAAEGNVRVGKVNVDEATQTAGRCNVMSIPTFILFKDGKEQKRLVGAMPKDKLLEILG